MSVTQTLLGSSIWKFWLSTQFKAGDIGAIVTIDAMGCQKDIATKIVKEKKADYVLSLKGNHEILKGEVEDYFKDVEKVGFKDDKILQYSTMEKGHGRIEERLYYYSTDIRWMDAKKDWTKLTGIGMVIQCNT